MGQRNWVLTGGLASGKSKIRQLFASHGIVTIDADRIGHTVLHPDGQAFPQVAARWPNVIREGQVDRAALSAVVFNDPVELAALESITHPHIFDTIRARVEEVDRIVVVELPILHYDLGEGWGRIVVDSPDDVRLRRAVGRGMSGADARSRMDRQPSRVEWLAAADVVAPNHGDLAELASTVSLLLPNL